MVAYGCHNLFLKIGISLVKTVYLCFYVCHVHCVYVCTTEFIESLSQINLVLSRVFRFFSVEVLKRHVWICISFVYLTKQCRSQAQLNESIYINKSFSVSEFDKVEVTSTPVEISFFKGGRQRESREARNVSNCPNLPRTAAIDVLFSINFAVAFDFTYFRFGPSRAK